MLWCARQHRNLNDGTDSSQDDSEDGSTSDSAPSENQALSLEDVLRPADIDVLPRWTVSRAVRELAEKFWSRAPPSSIPLRLTAGKALPLALLSLVASQVFSICFLCLIYFTQDCQWSDFEFPLAGTMALFTPVLVACLGLELLCFRYTIVPKYQVIGRFDILGVSVSFSVWFVVNAVKSVMQYYMTASQGLFFGTFFKTLGCEHDVSPQKSIRAHWDNLMRQSFFATVLGVQVPSVDVFLWICVCLLYVPPLFALASSIPVRRCWRVDYDLCTETRELNYVTQYDTGWVSAQNHGAALMSLANVNGMMTVFANDLDYAIKKAQASVLAGDLTIALKHMESQLATGIGMGLRGLVTAGAWLNLQVTLMGINCARDANHPFDHLQQVAILGLTIASSSLGILDVTRRVTSTFQWMRENRRTLEDAHVQEVRRYRQRFLLLSFLALLQSLVWLYAAVKFCALSVCPESQWNITGCAASLNVQ